MRLVLHLMKKDLRRLRLDLLAYAAFLAVVATASTNGFNTVETHETRVARPPLDPQFSSHIVVHHPTRREALYADVAPRHRALLLQFPVLLPYHLEVGAALLQTRVSTDLQLDQSWLDDAELARVEPVALGRFSLSLTIDDFTVKATMR